MNPTPPDIRSPEEVWDAQHQAAINTPLHWWLKAQSLMTAFEVLADDDERRAETGEPRRIQTVPYMLAGFAVENLLKGILVAKRQHVDTSGRFKLKRHDIRQLALDAGYVLSIEENRLLERVEQFTLWAARYPAPITADDMRPRATSDGGFAPRTYHKLGEDWPAIRALVARFHSDLRAMS